MRAVLVAWGCVLAVLLCAATFTACNRQAESVPPGASTPVRELLAERCATPRCHSQEAVAGKLDLSPGSCCTNLVGLVSSEMLAYKLVVPGEPQHSYLVFKIAGEKAIKGGQMPLGGPPLSVEGRTLIEDWIAAGAAE